MRKGNFEWERGPILKYRNTLPWLCKKRLNRSRYGLGCGLGWIRKHVLDWSAHRDNLANTTEWSMCGGSAAFLSYYIVHLFYFAKHFLQRLLTEIPSQKFKFSTWCGFSPTTGRLCSAEFVKVSPKTNKGQKNHILPFLLLSHNTTFGAHYTSVQTFLLATLAPVGDELGCPTGVFFTEVRPHHSAPPSVALAQGGGAN